MALLFFDGFDHYSGLPVTAKWASVGGTPDISAAVVRTGTNALRMTAAAATATTKVLPVTAAAGAITGGAFYATAIHTTDLMQVLEGTTVHMSVAITSGGLFVVKRGGTVLLTGTKVFALNNWYHLELKTVIHDTTGTYELKIDGIQELLNPAPADTRNAGTGLWDRVLFGGGGSGVGYWDDIYVCDTSGGSPRNDFLGPVKAETLYPQTDAVAIGSNTGLTPSTGTDHGALVDEPVPNTTDYNSSNVIGTKDTYQYPPLTLTGPIIGVQTNLYAAKSDAAARSVCAVVRSGGTDYDGANVSPLTSYLYYSEIRPQDPATSADWTTGGIAAMEVGMKVTV